MFYIILYPVLDRNGDRYHAYLRAWPKLFRSADSIKVGVDERNLNVVRGGDEKLVFVCL